MAPKKKNYSKPGKKRRKRRVRRECLRCGHNFMSEGNFNRICPSCREVNANVGFQVVEICIDLHFHF
jgi:Zn finger protein HypA/HybF involved in hydrogenase expression